IRREKEGELRFEGNLERIFAERALPTIYINIFWGHHHVAAFCQRRGFGDGYRVRGTRGDSLLRKAVSGSKTPSAVGNDADPKAYRFGLRQRANLTIFGGEVTLAKMHDPHVGIRRAAKPSGVERVRSEVPHSCLGRKRRCKSTRSDERPSARFVGLAGQTENQVP